jgi:proteasome accessory factor C
MSRDPYEGVRHALTIIPLIQAHQGITIDELALRTGLDEEQIRDELQNLVMLCGVPPYSPNNYVSLWIEDRQVYIRFAEQFERPVRLVVPEALALLLALRRLDRREHPYRDAVRRLQAKIKDAIGPEGVRELERAERAIVTVDERRGRLQQVRDAMAQCRELRITYWSAHRAALSERVIRPYGMTEFGGDWFVVAHDSQRQKPISFRVDRIRDAELLDSEYEIPLDFDIKSWDEASDFTAPPGKTVARVLFRGMGARFVRDELPRRDVRELPDGSLLARVTVRSEGWFLTWLLPYGADAEVVDPPELREKVAATCRRILDFYDEDAPAA